MNDLAYPADITRDRTPLTLETGGTPAQSLVTFSRLEADAWKQAIDEMLGWANPASGLSPEDAPKADILDTALDFAVDQIEDADGEPVPDSIVPSGGGRIAMEWNNGAITIIVEFVDRGIATYTEFRHGKVHRHGQLVRNPKSREMELRG